ncbi:hypothetical protein C1I97_30740 [Streptomyces sp. NTH33]|nr:hypothetical protein C1I97_30740 [Streptomyces sp. NTH33]
MTTLQPVRLPADRGAPAPHHRFPEQLIDAHRGRSRTTTDTTARITVLTAMPTITTRPLHDTRHLLPRPQTTTPL